MDSIAHVDYLCGHSLIIDFGIPVTQYSASTARTALNVLQ